MSDLNSNVKNTTDQIAGHAKEMFGDATNNEELELKGKIQSSTADAKKTVGEMKEKAEEKLNDIKEKAEGKINDLIDDNKTRSHVVFEPATIIAAVVIGVIGLVSLKMFSRRTGSKHKRAA